MSRTFFSYSLQQSRLVVKVQFIDEETKLEKLTAFLRRFSNVGLWDSKARSPLISPLNRTTSPVTQGHCHSLSPSVSRLHVHLVTRIAQSHRCSSDTQPGGNPVPMRTVALHLQTLLAGHHMPSASSILALVFNFIGLQF